MSDRIVTHPCTREYCDGWERIFGVAQKPIATIAPIDPIVQDSETELLEVTSKISNTIVEHGTTAEVAARAKAILEEVLSVIRLYPYDVDAALERCLKRST